MSLTILYWALLVVMLIGVVGAFVPGLPGVSLILVSVLVWGIATGFAGILVPLIVVFVVLILSSGVDFFATYWGAQRAGASKWAQWGAIIGLFLGFFGLLPAFLVAGPIIGLFIGPILGAFVGEFLYRGNLALKERFLQSVKACFGVVVGSLIGNVIEGFLALGAMAFFVYETWSVYGA